MSETASQLPPDPRVGTLVAGRYRILAPLGQGGIGAVFLAEDTSLRTRVALKLLRPELAQNAEVLARFEREARAMTALAHENIVQALGFGRSPDGDVCLVMELVEGETLRAVLTRRRPLPLALALAVTGQLAAALERAHGLGVVHRDLKPENVMVAWWADGRPRVKVLDFGMARIVGGLLGAGDPLTRRGAIFGTPEYMPPEQAMGMPVDARADQYALGVMLFEMLAGRRPFRADTALDMLQLHIHTPPPALCDLAPTIPTAVGSAVARMLAKRPDARFPDVRAAHAALQGAASAANDGGHHEGATAPRRWWQLFGR